MKKRIISFILIFVLAFCSTNVFSATTSVSDTERYENTYRILDAIGVFERYNTGGKGFDEITTRAEFISMCISVIVGDDSVFKPEISPFNDVSPTDTSYAEICVAYQLGIISGGGDGNFHPDNPVTYSEAIKILISVLGYEMVADSKGGFPAGYHSVAKSIDLDDGISNTKNSSLKYGDCLVLLLNALNTEVNEQKVFSTDNSISFQKGETLLYTVFKIGYGRGVLEENQYTTLYEPKNNADNHVVIGDFYGKIYSTVLAENYLGYAVEFYYQEDEAGDYVLYISPLTTNVVTHITSEDAVSVSGRTITYYPGMSQNRKTITLPASALVIYNGKAYPDYEMSIFETKDADFRFVDNDRNGQIDVVNVTAWESIFVHGIDEREERITDKYSSAFNIELKDTDNRIIWNSEYEKFNLSQVKVGSVANYVKSLDGKYVRIIITEDTKTGMVKSWGTKNGNTVLSLDGTEYVVSESYLKKVKTAPALGTSVTLYLDYMGKVAAIENGESDFEYGYIIAARKADDFFEDNLKIKLLKGNGQVSVVLSDKSLKVDGNKYTDGMLTHLNTPQVIRYKLSEDNIIKEIDTVTKGENESENSLRTLTALEKMKFYPSHYIFAGSGQGVPFDSNNILYCQLVANTNTKFIIVPSPDAEGITDEDYTVQPLNYLTSAATKVYQGFNADADSYIPDVVYMQSDGSGTLTRGNNPSLVTELYNSLNANDAVVKHIKLVDYRGVESELCFSEELDKSGVTVGVGDFINFSTDIRNDINDINIIYSNELRNFHPDNEYGIQYYGSDFNPHYGTAYDRDGSVLAFTTVDNPALVTYNDLQYLPLNDSMTVYVVDKNRYGYFVEKGTTNDIYDYKHFGIGSEIFFYTWQASVRMLIVYR